MPSAEPLVLVCGADDAYAMPLAVTLHSALVNLHQDCDPVVYLIDGGIDPERRGKLEKTVDKARPGVTIRWYEPDMARLEDLWVSGHVTAATYFTLLIAEAVPPSFERAIYLDSDVLVEADLSELWNVPFEGKALLAVQDYLIPFLGWPGGPVNLRESPQANNPYFNAGVLVLNLARWRAKGIAGRVLAYLREHADKLTFRDQEGLNAVLSGDVGLIDPRWNVATSLLWLERWPESSFKERMKDSREVLLEEPGIWHFTGPSKPWHDGFTHPARDRWQRHREQAGWPTSQVAGGTDLSEWLEERTLADREIAAVVPEGATLLLVGDSCLLPQSVAGRRALPFPEIGGAHGGNPDGDDAAIRELDRMRHCGGDFIVFERSAFWWLDYYRGFADHLRARYPCVRKSDRILAFDLGG